MKSLGNMIKDVAISIREGLNSLGKDTIYFNGRRINYDLVPCPETVKLHKRFVKKYEEMNK